MLLIDEVDRADDEFEAFLFELLAEASVTIPELGTLRATHPPIVVLTSNRTRDLHDALKRRCLYHWIDYPRAERAVEIVRRRVPGAPQPLAGRRRRRLSPGCARSTLRSRPGIAEAIDWVAALSRSGAHRLDAGGGRSARSARCSSTDEDQELAAGTRADMAGGRRPWLTASRSRHAGCRDG